MPLYDYQCPACGHGTELLRSYEARDTPIRCDRCGTALTRLPPLTHCSPDGIYSYAPNVGHPERFERQRQAMRDGVKVIPRTPDVPREHRDGQLTKRSPYG